MGAIVVRTRLAGIVAASIALTMPGCAREVAPSGSSVGSSSSGACALEVRWRGHRYSGTGVEVAPEEGARVGTAIVPGCSDGGGTGGSEPVEDERISVARLPGASARVALVWPGRSDFILIRDGVGWRKLPRQVTRLFQAPKCADKDAPIELRGPWLGIIEPGERTEEDLAPPYDLEIWVREASAPRYVGAFLDVRVTRDLGRPITRKDIRASLWEGGDIEIEASCRRGRYLADSVEAFPPA